MTSNYDSGRDLSNDYEFHESDEYPRRDGREVPMFSVKFEWPHKDRNPPAKYEGNTGWLACRHDATWRHLQMARQGYVCVSHVGFFSAHPMSLTTAGDE